MNNSYYQTPMFPNNNGLPNQQAMPKYDTMLIYIPLSFFLIIA